MEVRCRGRVFTSTEASTEYNKGLLMSNHQTPFPWMIMELRACDGAWGTRQTKPAIIAPTATYTPHSHIAHITLPLLHTNTAGQRPYPHCSGTVWCVAYSIIDNTAHRNQHRAQGGGGSGRAASQLAMERGPIPSHMHMTTRQISRADASTTRGRYIHLRKGK